MFFVPRPVTNWNDQVLKWTAAAFWFWTPIPSMVFIGDVWFYVMDAFQYNGDVNTKGLKPSMYDNWLAKMFMQTQDKMFGIFVWYDVFSMRGFLNWFLDSVTFMIFPWWEVGEAFIRNNQSNWRYGTRELND
jgi:hypothetical protein